MEDEQSTRRAGQGRVPAQGLRGNGMALPRDGKLVVQSRSADFGMEEQSRVPRKGRPAMDAPQTDTAALNRGWRATAKTPPDRQTQRMGSRDWNHA